MWAALDSYSHWKNHWAAKYTQTKQTVLRKYSYADIILFLLAVPSTVRIIIVVWGDNKTSANREIEDRCYYNYYDYNYCKDKDSVSYNYLNTHYDHYDSNARSHSPKEAFSVFALIIMASTAFVVVYAIHSAFNWSFLWLKSLIVK